MSEPCLPVRKRGRPRKNAIVSVAGESCFNLNTETGSLDPLEMERSSSRSVTIVSSNTQSFESQASSRPSLDEAFTPKSLYANIVDDEDTSMNDDSQSTITPSNTQSRGSFLSTPTSKNDYSLDFILGSSPPSHYTENELKIFADPQHTQSQAERPVSPINVLEEISMAPPQTPKRAANSNLFKAEISPYHTSRSSHVDPSMLFNEFMPSLWSSPPVSTSSIFTSSSPSTPKTFSNIIHSSPLYQGFHSSPVRGGSPSSIPQLLPLSNRLRLPLPASNSSRHILSKAFNSFPKLDFESLARGGVGKNTGPRLNKVSKNNGTKSQSRRRPFLKDSRLISSSGNALGKSLYDRRRAFFTKREPSSPSLPPSPKFLRTSGELDPDSKTPSQQRHNMYSSGNEENNPFLTPRGRKTISVAAPAITSFSADYNSPSHSKRVFNRRRMLPELSSRGQGYHHFPKQRRISLSISETGKAIINQEEDTDEFGPSLISQSHKNLEKPRGLSSTCPNEIIDDRYESSEEEDEEEEETDHESPEKLYFPSFARSITSSPANSKKDTSDSPMSSFQSQFRVKLAQIQQQQQSRRTLPYSPSSVSTASSCMDRSSTLGMSSPMSSPIHGSSPISNPSPRFLVCPKVKRAFSKRQNLESVFPVLNSPYLKSNSSANTRQDRQPQPPSSPSSPRAVGRFSKFRSVSEASGIVSAPTAVDLKCKPSSGSASTDFTSGKVAGAAQSKTIDAREAFHMAMVNSQYLDPKKSSLVRSHSCDSRPSMTQEKKQVDANDDISGLPDVHEIHRIASRLVSASEPTTAAPPNFMMMMMPPSSPSFDHFDFLENYESDWAAPA